MSTINPAARLYEDMLKIIDSLTIKYSANAEIYETFYARSVAEMYMSALNKRDSFFSYRDYTEEEYKAVGVTDEGDLIDYMNNQDSVPLSIQQKILENRRDSIINNYDEQNEYYRELNGLPPLEDIEKDFLYVSKEYCDAYNIPENLPIHKVEDELGSFYISLLEGIGYIDDLISENPDKRYLRHLGKRRIDIYRARKAKNFSILYLDSSNIMESIHREFVKSYDKCREYFVTVCYVHEYSSIIEYYDNFIGLAIFIMTMQQVSARMISNAVDREFYDDYSIQLLYETYGVPFNKKIDELTQKQIVQNVNLLVQNKACNKVLLDIASILGFESIKIYEYYLMKERLFDADGRPVILTKQKWDEVKGEYITVPKYEDMYDLHFQKVAIDEENVHKALLDPLNRVEYLDLTLYDPFWWEDDDTYTEVWQEEYNRIETKYLGVTIPYRMTEMLFQSIIQFHMIFDKSDELFDITLDLPKITSKKVSLVESIILLSALMCKKYNISGYLVYAPSQIIHILEILDREINHDEDKDIEILKFDFEAFNYDVIEKIREERIQEEINKLSDEESDQLFERTLVFAEDDQIREEMLELMKDGLSRIPDTHETINVDDYNSFISGDINKINIGTFPESIYSKVNFILNEKIQSGNYSIYFSIDFDKHWTQDNDPESNHLTPDISDEVNDENDRTFTVYIRVKNRLEKTKEILEKHLVDKSYITSFIQDRDGGHYHDIDLNPDGTQNTKSFRKLRDVVNDLRMLNQFYDCLVILSSKSLGVSKEEKVKALNNLYKNIKELYYFISFRMTETNNYTEYYALKKFYDTAFYAQETTKAFTITDADGKKFQPETFLEYLRYKNLELCDFVENCEPNLLYLYIDHVIYKLEDLLDNVDYLYILNDNVSPLQELLVQLITFFKSFTTDMVKLSSVMIMDWKIENTLKLIDHPQYIGKEILMKSILRLSHSDFTKKVRARLILDERLKLEDKLASILTNYNPSIWHQDTDVNDYLLLEDSEKQKNRQKISMIITEEEFNLLKMSETQKYNSSLRVNDSLSLSDDVFIKVEEN